MNVPGADRNAIWPHTKRVSTDIIRNISLLQHDVRIVIDIIPNIARGIYA